MANMTRAQLRAQVYSRLAEVAGFHDDASINQWLRDGVIDASVITEPLVATAQATTVTGTGEYNLPSGYLTVKSVFYKDTNNKWSELDETTFQSLWESNPNWETDTQALPSTYYWRGDFIGLYPIPSAAVAGANKLRILYAYGPPDFASDSGTSGLPEWFDKALISYAVWRCRLKDRDEPRAQTARADYDIALGYAVTLINRHRKQTAPKLEPDMSMYRQYYQSTYPSFRVEVV